MVWATVSVPTSVKNCFGRMGRAEALSVTFAFLEAKPSA
jgi:hypothetical protein